MLRVGVIGTGLIGRDHIQRIKHKIPNAKVTALNDINVSYAELINREEDLEAQIFDSSEELIFSDMVDAVVITSWGETHENLVLKCINARKPVFCEKPLAMTLEGCKRIVEKEVELNRKFVQVGYMRRYDNYYLELKEVLDSKKIGEPLIVRGAHRMPKHPRNKGDMAITEASVHELDTIRWLLKNDEFITAQVIVPKSTSYVQNSVSDPHIIILSTSKGVHVDIEIFVHSHYGYDIQCQVIGETGIVNLPDLEKPIIRKNFNIEKSIARNWKERFDSAYDSEILNWVNKVKEGRIDGPSAWDGFKVQEVIDACLKSKKTGRKINISSESVPSLYL